MDTATPSSSGRAHRLRPLSVAAAVLGLPLVYWLVRTLDPALAQAGLDVVILNALPALILLVLLWILTRRPFLALVLTCLLLRALFTVHEVKLLHTEQPLVPGDFTLIGQVVRDLGFYVRYASFSWVHIGALLAIVFGVMEKPWLPLKRMPRAIGAALLLILGTSLFAGWKPWSNLYSVERMQFKAWSPRDSAGSAGMLGHFLWMTWHTQRSLPEPDTDLLDHFRKHQQDATAENGQRPETRTPPDIVIVQSESLFDPGRMRAFDGSPHLGTLRGLSPRALSGNLRVPAYGGLTTRTEFEVLTGYPIRTFNAAYPYQGLVHRPIHALPRTLRDAGYRTIAIHPYAPHFYRRNTVYPLLGFDTFLSASDFRGSDYHGHYISDAAVTTKLISLLEDSGPPMLLFVVTMENHGPWNARRPLDPEALATIAVPDSLDPESALALRMYLHHLDRADLALRDLVDFIDARERETWLLFFGDHLPALQGAFEHLGFKDDRPPWSQPVPYLLLSNRRELQGTRDLESHELADLLLEHAGLELDPFFSSRTALRRMQEDPDAEPVDAESVLTNLVLERYQARIEESVTRAPGIEARIATVDAWGPKGTETVRHAADAEPAPSAIWLRVEGMDPERTLRVRMSGVLLDGHAEGNVIFGHLSAAQKLVLFSEPARHSLELVDTESGEWQAVGEFEVRRRAARLRLANGKRAASFCPIDGWGPKESPRDASANLQPDGSLGLWFRASCWPRSVLVLFGDVELEATRDDQVVTVAVPRRLFAHGGSITLGIADKSNNERVGVGTLNITD